MRAGGVAGRPEKPVAGAGGGAASSAHNYISGFVCDT